MHHSYVIANTKRNLRPLRVHAKSLPSLHEPAEAMLQRPVLIRHPGTCASISSRHYEYKHIFPHAKKIAFSYKVLPTAMSPKKKKRRKHSSKVSRGWPGRFHNILQNNTSRFIWRLPIKLWSIFISNLIPHLISMYCQLKKHENLPSTIMTQYDPLACVWWPY